MVDGQLGERNPAQQGDEMAAGHSLVGDEGLRSQSRTHGVEPVDQEDLKGRTRRRWLDPSTDLVQHRPKLVLDLALSRAIHEFARPPYGPSTERHLGHPAAVLPPIDGALALATASGHRLSVEVREGTTQLKLSEWQALGPWVPPDLVLDPALQLNHGHPRGPADPDHRQLPSCQQLEDLGTAEAKEPGDLDRLQEQGSRFETIGFAGVACAGTPTGLGSPLPSTAARGRLRERRLHTHSGVLSHRRTTFLRPEEREVRTRRDADPMAGCRSRLWPMRMAGDIGAIASPAAPRSRTTLPAVPCAKRSAWKRTTGEKAATRRIATPLKSQSPALPGAEVRIQGVTSRKPM